MMYIVPTCFIKNGTLTDPFILKYCYQNYLHLKKMITLCLLIYHDLILNYISI